MEITKAGSTLVISDASQDEQKQILSAINKKPGYRELLTRKQTAQIFGIHPGSLKRWEKSGRIHALKITPRCVRYDRQEVEAILSGGEL